MEEKVWKLSALFLAVLAVLAVLALPYLPALHTIDVEFREARLAQKEYEENLLQMKHIAMQNGGSADTKNGKIRIRLPEGVDGSRVQVTNDYVKQTIQIVMPQTDEAYFDSAPISGSSSYIDMVSYRRQGGTGLIEIVTDRVYELDLTYDEDYYYFNFLTPHEVYDKVVVIDAGHGGRDPGTIRQGLNEKDVNLAIALQLKSIFEESDEKIGVYYTRMDDSNPSYEQRVQLANETDADLFISIHNNSLQGRRVSSTKGTQVMYSETSGLSEQFAQICLEEMTKMLGSDNRGLVEGNSIYIIRNSEVPAALIEVGFMTNPEELALLGTETYQRQAAEGIYRSVFRAFEEGY